MYRRHLVASLELSARDTPVALLLGSRQSGKSTLAMAYAQDHGIPYRTLDDMTMLAAAQADPEGFVRGLGGRAVIDEVQRSPGLLIAIKASVDRERQPGRFLLTGSANVLTLPRVAESLAGRMEVLVLRPLSQGEMAGCREGFLDILSDAVPDCHAPETRERLLDRVRTGGFPEAVARDAPERRGRWFSSYLAGVLQRDVRDLANITHLTDMPRLLATLALRTAGQGNFAELSRTTGIPASSLKRYLGLLETIFLYEPLPAWAGNPGKRLAKAPTIHLVDSGLAAALAGIPADDPRFVGPLLESFVVGELRKQAGSSRHAWRFYHYRTAAGQEVDLVAERDDGVLLGIEVKAAASVGTGDFRGLRAFDTDCGGRLRRGIVLHTGLETVRFDERFAAVPLPVLWQAGD